MWTNNALELSIVLQKLINRLYKHLLAQLFQKLIMFEDMALLKKTKINIIRVFRTLLESFLINI